MTWWKTWFEAFKTAALQAKAAGKVVPVLLAVTAAVLLAGCGTTQTLAEGIAEKSISGAGTVAIQRVGIDPDTKTPVLKSTVITGDYASARSGEYALQYRRKRSPSIWNSDAVTEEVTINYIGTREHAATALDVAKQDVTAAGAQPGLTQPEAVTPTTPTATTATTAASPPTQAATSTPTPPADAAK